MLAAANKPSSGAGQQSRWRDLLISCLNHFKEAKLARHAQNFCSCFVVDFTHNITDEEIKAADDVMTQRIQNQLTAPTERCIKGKLPAVAREGWKWILQE